MKTGIFGGTFNPIHNGHIELARYCKRELKLDRIILIPTFTPPHKTCTTLADSSDRFNMCQIACQSLNGFEVSDIEFQRGGKSYTCDTLRTLKEKYPHDELFLITGADMFLTLHSWKNPQEIFSLADIITLPRSDSTASELETYYKETISSMGAKAHILPSPVVQVSSTYIRENISDYSKVCDLISSQVYDYIIKNKLYGM